MRKFLLIFLTILICSSTVFGLTHTSPSYTLKDARIIPSSGKTSSINYSLNDARIGSVFGGKALSLNYSLDATNLAKKFIPQPPNPPTVNPVTTPTNISTQTLTGTKDADTSIYINGYLAVPQDNHTAWSYEVSLEEGENYFIITSRNQHGLESESVLVAITLDTTPPVLSIAISPNGWNAGEVEQAGTITMSNEQKITVTNDGEAEENFILSLENPADWCASSQPGVEEFVLNAAFSSVPENISWNEANHALTTEPDTCTETRFAADQTGVSVPPGEARSLFLQFKAPTASETEDKQTITLIISCEIPAE